MEKKTFINKIKAWIAGICFRLFIWGNNTTEKEYWTQIYDQEYYRRHRKKSIQVRVTDLRGLEDIKGKPLYMSHLLDTRKRTFSFPSNGRRTGRTTILISRSIFELLNSGETMLTDHLYDHGRHTTDYYHKHIIPPLVKALSGLLNLESREVRDSFDMLLITNDERKLIGLYILNKFYQNRP